MTQKMAITLSATLSAFVLALIAGVSGFMAKGEAPVADTFSQQEVAQIISERDAAYEEVIAEANRQLAAAQGSSSVEGANTSAEGESLSAYIEPELASLLASQLAVGDASALASAELVDFEGTVAYEIPFSAGNIYMDAISGDLLFNGTISLAPSLITQSEATAIAGAYMEGKKIYKVELYSLNGEDVYRVKFVNSDAVFVNQYGQIVLVRLAPEGQTASKDSGSSYHDDDDDDDDDDPEEHEEEDDD